MFNCAKSWFIAVKTKDKFFTRQHVILLTLELKCCWKFVKLQSTSNTTLYQIYLYNWLVTLFKMFNPILWRLRFTSIIINLRKTKMIYFYLSLKYCIEKTSTFLRHPDAIKVTQLKQNLIIWEACKSGSFQCTFRRNLTPKNVIKSIVSQH